MQHDEEYEKRLLIIFQKNLISGRVKTRLARSIGDDKALKVYSMLIRKTWEATRELEMSRWIYYGAYIEKEDIWTDHRYAKKVQSGDDLGERMLSAFREGFRKGFGQICIIGTDCYDISRSIILDAFRKLESSDIVIGPAEDGGYYLLGMTHLVEPLFLDKNWSTSSVLEETLKDIRGTGLSFEMVETLNDIDTLEDLQSVNELKFIYSNAKS